MKPHPILQRFDNAIAKQRKIVLGCIDDIAKLAQTPTTDEPGLSNKLHEVERSIRTARQRMTRVRAWKDARSLVAHFVEKGTFPAHEDQIEADSNAHVTWAVYVKPIGEATLSTAWTRESQHATKKEAEISAGGICTEHPSLIAFAGVDYGDVYPHEQQNYDIQRA